MTDQPCCCWEAVAAGMVGDQQCCLCGRYVHGDYRFQRGYSSSNPRKMVQVWAEKEMRNLARIHAAGIPCPKPQALRLHILIMDFLGSEGAPAPRLHVRPCLVAALPLTCNELEPAPCALWAVLFAADKFLSDHRCALLALVVVVNVLESNL